MSLARRGINPARAVASSCLCEPRNSLADGVLPTCRVLVREESARRRRMQRSSGASEAGEGGKDGHSTEDHVGASGSGTKRRGEAAADNDDRPAWELVRDDLADVIVSEGLYKLSDLRALFHETVVAAAGDDGRIEQDPEAEATGDQTTRKAAAQQAVAFVCNELDLPAIARLALQTPELLAPNFEGRRSSLGGASSGSHGSGGGPSDSDGSLDRPVKITHWSESQDYAFRTQDYGHVDDDVPGA